jgi:hypothetical protein
MILVSILVSIREEKKESLLGGGRAEPGPWTEECPLDGRLAHRGRPAEGGELAATASCLQSGPGSGCRTCELEDRGEPVDLGLGRVRRSDYG